MESQNPTEFIPMPRIGDKAPSFKAVTTQGEISFPEQYAGNWVILFSHPADFTPVCTSEFITFASLEGKFAEANCKLVGLSVDGLYSHIAWLRTIGLRCEYVRTALQSRPSRLKPGITSSCPSAPPGGEILFYERRRGCSYSTFS
jgi:peroxiredoxin